MAPSDSDFDESNDESLSLVTPEPPSPLLPPDSSFSSSSSSGSHDSTSGQSASKVHGVDIESSPTGTWLAGASDARVGDLSAPAPSTSATGKLKVRNRSSVDTGGSSGSSSNSSSASSFPTPFRCYGDFCGFELFELPRQPHQQPNPATAKLDGDAKRSSSSSTVTTSVKARAKALAGPLNALQMLFPPDELAALNTDSLSNLLLRPRSSTDDTVSSPVAVSKTPVASTDLHVITYKSIALAKANREHLKITLQAQKRAEHGELADRRGGSTKNASASSSGKAGRRRSSLLDSTAAQDFRHDSRLRVFGEMGDGVASYYRQVRVCSDCYAIYTLLDAARKLKAAREGGSTGAELDKHRQQLLKRKLHDEWDQHVASELVEKEKLYLRKPKGGAASPTKQSTGAAPQVEKPSSDAEAAPAARLKLGDALVERGAILPMLLSPKELRSEPRSDSSEPLSSSLLHSVSMPALSSTSSGGGGKPSCFALPVASSSDSAATRQHVRGSAGVRGLDRYLRGENRRIAEPALVEGELFASKAAGASSESRSSTPVTKSHVRASASASSEVRTVLLVGSDAASLELLHRGVSAIPSLALDVESFQSPHEALAAAQRFHYDLVLCERDLAAAGLRDGLEFVRRLRQFELQASVTASGDPARRRTAVICVAAETSRDDLQRYRDAGMDGCVGKPLSLESLHRTVRAALAGAADAAVSSATEALAHAKREQLERKRRRRRRLEAASALPLPGLAAMDAREDVAAGTFQLDAETAVPYCVLGRPELQPARVPNTFFGLVVVHDLFDTWERLQLLLQPVFARYGGAVQVLVWNYPGQAYTSWRRGALLNNAFHAQCLHALLRHLGPRGRGLWRDAPYFLLGIGNGGSVAAAFCAHAPPLDANVRALVLVNAFAFVDAPLAQFLHDSLAVLATTPESRPDLPVYFHARFLFSPAYLARVSAPLALNLLTAVANPISLAGRRALCLGALANADVLRGGDGGASRLRVPLLAVCSAQNALVDAGAQVAKLAGLETVDSIAKALASSSVGRKSRCCVVSLPGGHEALQECKQELLLLLEQLVTGYHEAQASPPKAFAKPFAKPRAGLPSRDEEQGDRKAAKPRRFEDAFLDNALASAARNQLPSPERVQWTQFQHESAQRTTLRARDVAALDKQQLQPPASSKRVAVASSWDPTTPAFERLSSNVIYKVGDGSKIYPGTGATGATGAGAPELKEYMAWRVKRNQKRLERMARQARVIQRAFRAFSARARLRRVTQTRCAVALQRLWRAKLARTKYKGLRKEDWAARLLQRHWRGKLGRDAFSHRVRRYLAAVAIQRVARGFLAAAFVTRIRRRLHASAVAIQRLARRFLARRRAFRLRRRRNGALAIQRVFRGHVGRRRFARERDKFVYSTTQSQGIAFGKQMLLEYKLAGTQLQSHVALLAKAKADVEAQAEVLVREICDFDDGIRLLEAEMHALSRAETDASGRSAALDEPSRWALREQKMRLDREFTQMLAQLAVRKERLGGLELKLQQLDRERLEKEDELKGLERKLVVLLDEQQHELAKIKAKQHQQQQLALDLASPASASAGSASPSWTLGSASAAAAHSASAFTQQQREEANSLMESTETMMKFGFMSMSMTYFSSMNMVRAMRKIGAHHMTLDSAAAVANHKWPELGASGGGAASAFEPAVPSGSFPGQQPLQVAGWSVADVGRWLDTLALGQYKRAFADAATDGALLLHLNDDDLKNTLGLEHRLHRKKVLTSVEQLREAERVKMLKLFGVNQPDSLPTGATGAAGVGAGAGAALSPSRAPQPSSFAAPLSPGAPSSPGAADSSESANASAVAGANLKVVVAFPEFCALVRHGKVKQLKEALASVPDRRFDPLAVRQPFAPGVGTVYDDLLEKSAFHLNKSDENGNSPLLLAAQNNGLKVAQLLVAKGANPNHQNRNGNTAGHYAMAYSFFDLGAWLLDPDKGGGRDDLLNDNGLAAYDGLS